MTAAGVPPDGGRVLLPLARAATAQRLGEPAPPVPDAAWLAQEGASFVTLHLHEALRGCIGTLEAYRPLGEDVAGNAVAAAFTDRRFPPVTAVELAEVRLEVSVLSHPRPLSASTEAEAVAVLRPGVDGVVLARGSRRATFLPQVWDAVPDAREFLSRLRAKAGLTDPRWGGIRLSTYTVTAWEEP